MVTRNPLALVRNGIIRATSHQAVVRLVVKLERRRRWCVELRKVGLWHLSELQKRLRVWR